jgi:hypothetical protein
MTMRGIRLLASCLLASVLAPSLAGAQEMGCKAPVKATVAVLVPPGAESSQSYNRRSIGSEIELIAKTQTAIPNNAKWLVCYRWKTTDGTGDFIPELPAGMQIQDDRTLVKVRSIVPDLGPMPSGKTIAYASNLPLAEVRLLITTPDGTAHVDVTTVIGIEDAGCRTPPKPATAGGASIVGAATDTLQHKNWQPVGGDIQFTLRSAVKIDPDATVIVCFRWKTDDAKLQKTVPPAKARPSRVQLESDGTVLKVTTTVPELGPPPTHAELSYTNFIVPLAEARVLVTKNTNVIADAGTRIGVTNPRWAIILTIALAIVALAALTWICRRRLPGPLARHANWFLCIIATPRGYASLSQLQILIWTFVIAAAVIYVMTLSGELIQITVGTLALLGISGAATVASKAQSQNQEAKTAPPPDGQGQNPPPAARVVDPDAIAKQREDEARKDKDAADQVVVEKERRLSEAKQQAYEAQAAADKKAQDGIRDPGLDGVAAAAQTAADQKAADSGGVRDAVLDQAASAARAAADAKAAETAGTRDPALETIAAEKKRAVEAADQDLVKARENAAAAQRALAAVVGKQPKWSDLIINEVWEKGVRRSEIDVTRVQMLYFTLIAAAFVLMTVMSTYVIPEIPQNFLILMGISNGVYLTSKFVQTK